MEKWIELMLSYSFIGSGNRIKLGNEKLVEVGSVFGFDYNFRYIFDL